MKKGLKNTFWTRYAYKEIGKFDKVNGEKDLFLLSEKELLKIKKITRTTVFRAGLAGVLGVVCLYVPYHYFGTDFFPLNKFWLPFYDGYVELELTFLVYSLVLVLIEIWFLTYLNIKAVAKIAHACGYSRSNDKHHHKNVTALVAVGLEKKQKQLQSIGINPYEGLSPLSVFIYTVILKLKAALSGFLFKLFVKKALGRYALRLFIDYAGIPVYAFWNIWGSQKIIKEAKVRVIAPPLIEKFVETIFEEQKSNTEFIKAIYDTLQLISVSKRSFHYNHYLLSVTTLEKFGIEIDKKTNYNNDFLEQIPLLKNQTKIAIQKLLIFGMIIDGSVSYREIKVIRYLREKGVLTYSETDIVKWLKDYVEGRGIDHFLRRM